MPTISPIQSKEELEHLLEVFLGTSRPLEYSNLKKARALLVILQKLSSCLYIVLGSSGNDTVLMQQLEHA